MGENHFEPVPTALYGVVLFFAGVAYKVLQSLIIADQGKGSKLCGGQKWARTSKGKDLARALRDRHVAAAFVHQWIFLMRFYVAARAPVARSRRTHRA